MRVVFVNGQELQVTNFYINADGNPVVCFEKYEVSPGFMGVQEFVIEKPAE